MSDRSARAVFLDRDGTLIEDVGYPREPERVRLLPGVVEGLVALRGAGYLAIVVSNQSGIGRGIVSPQEATAVHERFVRLLAAQGVAIDAAKYCPHAPGEGCRCRKPEPGMLLDAAAELGVDLESSYMIGDKKSDAEAGARAGCRTILLAGPEVTPGDADRIVADLPAAVGSILAAEPAR